MFLPSCLTIAAGSGSILNEQIVPEFSGKDRFFVVSDDGGEKSDVSPENDGNSKLEYDTAFDGPLRKEWTREAVEILGRTDHLRPPPG